jgi:hypothetical protein
MCLVADDGRIGVCWVKMPKDMPVISGFAVFSIIIQRTRGMI